MLRDATGTVDPRLAEALKPVLADVRRTSDVVLQVKPERWSDVPGQLTAMVWAPDGSGTGVSVMDADSQADRVVRIADQVQEIVVEALWAQGRPATWPECPAHPAGHPLKAARHSLGPTWQCPVTAELFFTIGGLGACGRTTLEDS